MSKIQMAALALAAFLGVGFAPKDDRNVPRTEKYQVTGLFRPDRENDFREAMKDVPEVRLVALDYKNAEASFEFIPAKAFPGAGKPEQILQQLDNKVRQATRHTFGLKPRRTVPREKLALVEIAVGGCDCKACDLGAYEIVAKLPGVEQATACFREGRVTALIDPTKTDRAKLVEALKRREVRVKMP